MAGYRKSGRPQGDKSNRAKRKNAKETREGSRYTTDEHDKAPRPPGRGQGDPRGHRGRPS
jgi:hypothetical protein